MNDFYGFLICSDIDGTLYNSDRVLSDRNRAAIAAYTAAGGLFTIATGRTPRELTVFDRSILSAPIVASCGSILLDYRTGGVLLDKPFEADGYGILREIWQNYPEITGMLSEDNYTLPGLSRESGESIDTLFAAFQAPWHKAIFLMEDVAARERLETEFGARYGDRYVFDSAWAYSVEMHKGDKGTGVQALRRMLGERARVVICVGDHTNDIPMIREADIGCAVANALPVTRAAADYVTVSNDEDAIAYIIEHALSWAKEKNKLSYGV